MKQGDGIDSPPLPISAKMAKALANGWRNQILTVVSLQGPMSPTEFVELFGGPELGIVARYFRQLKGWGFLEIVEERRGGKRRGAVEKVYRATQPVHFDTATWEALPLHLREEGTGTILAALLRRIVQASEARTLDKKTDNHISWKLVLLDRQAWTEYNTQLDDDLAWVSDLEAESASRAAESGEELISATVALLAFPSPPQTKGD